MIYLALDQALQTTGYAIFENSNLIASNIFKTKNSALIDQRLGAIWKNLNNIKAEYDFSYVFLEDCQQQANIQTYHKLSMVKATVLLWCYFNDVKYSILSPTHWRSILKEKYNVSFGKKREDQKKASMNFVNKYYKKKVSEDEADAICLGCAGMIEKNKNASAF